MGYLLKTRKVYKYLKKQVIKDLSKKLDKACFRYDMAYVDFKGLPRRASSDKVLRDKAFNIAKNLKYDEYQCGLASVLSKYFDKTSTGISTHT